MEPAPRVRRNAWSDGDEDGALLAWYATAVAALRARPDDDPTSWSALAASYGSTAEHATWLFLPWHRAWLAHVERVVLAAVVAAGGPRDWAVPYWDPARGGREAAVPLPFRGARRAGEPNPLHAVRAPGIDEGARLRTHHTDAEQALGLTDFTGPAGTSLAGARPDPERFTRYRGELERGPYDAVRTLVGGPMGASRTAALDPLFPLQLATVDRLWDRWLARAQGRANPRDPRWRGTVLAGVGGDHGVRVADVVDETAVLGYRYDDAPSPATRALRARLAVTSRPPAPPPGPPRTVAATDGGVTLTGRTSITLALGARSTRAVEAVLDDPGGGARVLLGLDQVEAPVPPGVVYDVHLDPVEHDRPAGVLAFGDAGGRPVDEAFDVTGLLDLLRRQGRWTPDALTVTLVPAGPTPLGHRAHRDPAPHAPATIAQVSLRCT